MLYNYLKVTLRNMARYKGYTFLNVAGLSVGLAVCFLLFLWVKDELSYDRFHEKAGRMYRSVWKARFGENEWEIPQVPMPLAGTMAREFPEVEWVTQIFEGGFTLKKDDEWVREKNVLFVDEGFFKVFSVEAVAGNLSAALEDPNTVLLTEDAARRYFGDSYRDDALGRTVRQNDGKDWHIGGIVKNWPEQSHLKFDFLAPLKSLPHLEQRKEQWSSASCLTYFTLKNAAGAPALHAKLQAWVDKHLMADKVWQQGGNYTSFPFHPVADIYLKPNRSYIWIFSITGIFILVVAGINFINLATARALTRAREVGVRKALGSTRPQLVRQFFGEALVYVLVSAVLAVLLAEAALPFFNDLAGKNLTIDFLHTPFVWLLLGALLLVTTLLTGAFPALMLSAFDPARVLKGDTLVSGGRSRLRKGLVVLQFCISIALIIGTLVVKKQMDYLQSSNLGFDREHVLVVRRATALGDNYAPYIERLRTLGGVERVSIAQFMPGDEFDSTIFLPEQPSNYKETSLSYTHIDPDFVDALKLKIVAGRNLDARFQTDSTACLINQTAAQRLGWDDPVGKKLGWGGDNSGGEIVGVVEDFNFASLHQKIEPLVIRMAPWKMPNILVRLQPGDVAGQLAALQSGWREMAPNAPFEYSFLDKDFQKLYEKEERLSKAFLLFAGLSIFIACLGLFGLSAFMANQRRKEIGIRKVLGATTTGLVGLLSKDFLQLVFWALIIAAPPAWFLLDKWLQNFAYRTQIHWTVFALAGVVAITVALLTVSVQSVRAALANPARSLRSE